MSETRGKADGCNTLSLLHPTLTGPKLDADMTTSEPQLRNVEIYAPQFLERQVRSPVPKTAVFQEPAEHPLNPASLPPAQRLLVDLQLVRSQRLSRRGFLFQSRQTAFRITRLTSVMVMVS